MITLHTVRVYMETKTNKLDAIVEESLRGAAIFDEVKDSPEEVRLGLSGGQAAAYLYCACTCGTAGGTS